MGEENYIKLLLKIVEKIKDELLLFTILGFISVVIFPEQRWLISAFWFFGSTLYTIIKLNSKNVGGSISQQFGEALKKKNKWVKKFENNREFWVYQDNPLLHIEFGEKLVDDFKEPWMKEYPDMNHNFSFKVYLKHTNTVVEDFAYVSLDGVRYYVPLPETDQGNYYYKKNSLKFLSSNVIGEFYRYNSLVEFAKDHKIELK